MYYVILLTPYDDWILDIGSDMFLRLGVGTFMNMGTNLGQELISFFPFFFCVALRRGRTDFLSLLLSIYLGLIFSHGSSQRIFFFSEETLCSD